PLASRMTQARFAPSLEMHMNGWLRCLHRAQRWPVASKDKVAGKRGLLLSARPGYFSMTTRRGTQWEKYNATRSSSRVLIIEIRKQRLVTVHSSLLNMVLQ